MQRADGVNTFYAESRAAWRQWLIEHHEKEASVWLIIYKKASQKPTVTYKEAVREALCFGWIDSKPNKRDADSYFQYFSLRKAKSNWSKVNKDMVAALEAEGLMYPQGLAMVDLAKASGTWTALDAVSALKIPDDLAAALQSFPKAAAHFDAFPPSTKRGILEWILNAKRPATRAKRIAETASLAAKNQRANQYRKKS